MRRLMDRSQCGQVTAETAVMFALAISGLVALAVYIQRGVQGNLFGGTQSIGLQYDPRDAGNRETQRLVNLNEVQEQVTRQAMVEAELLTPVDPDERSTGSPAKFGKWKMTLKSLPTGPIPREPTAQESTVDTTWTTSRDGVLIDAR